MTIVNPATHKKSSQETDYQATKLAPQRDNEMRETIRSQKGTLASIDDFDTIFARVNFQRGDYRRDGQQHQAASAQHSSKSGTENIEKRGRTTNPPVPALSRACARDAKFYR